MMATYLTNFTGASANNGKTPYELWYGHKPSLSHLCEIGCCMFALIPTYNPKIHHHSISCILIGYVRNLLVVPSGYEVVLREVKDEAEEDDKG